MIFPCKIQSAQRFTLTYKYFQCIHKDNETCELTDVFYRYKKTRASKFVSRDRIKSCQRTIFNCDHQFALDIKEHHGVYREKYHTFLGPHDNYDPEKCVVGTPIARMDTGGVAFEAECCGGGKRRGLKF